MEANCGGNAVATIVSKLPLSPEDSSVLEQAVPLGWDTCAFVWQLQTLLLCVCWGGVLVLN